MSDRFISRSYSVIEERAIPCLTLDYSGDDEAFEEWLGRIPGRCNHG